MEAAEPFLTFQMVPSDGVQAVIHPSQGVNGAFCVHILFPSPHVHYGVVAVEPGHVLSIVNAACNRCKYSRRVITHYFPSTLRCGAGWLEAATLIQSVTVTREHGDQTRESHGRGR